MANYSTLKAAIAQVIKTNGNNEITGNLLQQQLFSMINTLGAGYQCMGVAVLTPTPTNPGTPDANVFYIASEPGTYANFGNIVINDGEVCLLTYNGTWSKRVTGAATASQLNQLGQDLLKLNVNAFEKKLAQNAVKTEEYYVDSGGTIIQNDYARMFKVPIVLGKTYMYDKVGWNTAVWHDLPDVTFFDEDDNFLGYQELLSGPILKENVIITNIPSNAAYFYVNSMNRYATVVYEFDYDFINLQDSAKQLELRSALPVRGTQVNAVSTESGYVYTIDNGKIVKVANENGKIVSFNINPQNNYLYTGIRYSLGWPGPICIFVDSYGSPISYYGVKELNKSWNVADRFIYDIPKNAVKLCINAQVSSLGDNLAVYEATLKDYSISELQSSAMVAGPSSLYKGWGISSLNDVRWKSGVWRLMEGEAYTNAPNGFVSGYLISAFSGDGTIQILIDDTKNTTYRRVCDTNVWSSWVTMNNMMGSLASTDLNTVTQCGTWLLGGSNNCTNLPSGETMGFLRVSNTDGVWGIQEFFSFTGGGYYKRRFDANDSAFESWQRVSGVVNNITNNYSFPEYSQENTISCTPSITTDTNNYLASTNDSTDRTSAILTMLQNTGVCRLGPGVFYVDGLQMPDETSLIGSGVATEVHLISGSNKFAIKLGTDCIVRDFSLIGDSWVSLTGVVGDRHGILWQGDFTETKDTGTQPMHGIVTNLQIRSFTGGGITCYDTGTGVHSHLSVTDVNIWDCEAGINISYYSEFHQFTNVSCSTCSFGCINNGGNNVFTNCNFSGNKLVGMLMDNSQGQSPNNTHGSCVGCLFHHIGTSDSGVSVKILNCPNGFMFSGCHIQCDIVLDTCEGVVFSACGIFAASEITIDNGGMLLFIGDMFQGTPTITITNNDKVKFVNCYNRTTGALINP